jgi:NADH-quinone oxidoreductase subunit G
MLLDLGRLQDGEPHLAGTAAIACARLCAATAAELGIADGETLTVHGRYGSLALPLVITEELPERVVWVPTNSAGSRVRADLGVAAGDLVTVGRQ